MAFGEKLQELRKSRGWTQEQLASEIGVSRQALSKWESGSTVPDTENVIRLAVLFGVSTDYLLLDAPAPREEADSAPAQFSRPLPLQSLLGGILAVLSALGLLVLGILGSGGDYEILAPIPDGDGGCGVISRGFFAFLEVEHLSWLFFLLLFLVGIGVLLAALPYWKKRNPKD